MTTLEYSRLLRRRAQEAEARQLIRQSQLTRHNNEGRFSRLFKWGPFNKRGRVHPVGASQTTQDKVLVAQQQQSSPSEKFTSPPLSGDDSTSILPR